MKRRTSLMKLFESSTGNDATASGSLLRIEAITNAAFLITLADGRTILTDPWFSDGIYYGSWYNFPPLSEAQKKRYHSLRPDFIYISHLHPDHMDARTLAHYDSATPLLIGALPMPHLERNLKDMGFSDIRVLPLDETVAIEGITITILGQFEGTSSGDVSDVDYEMDTSLVLESGGRRLLNVVDNPIKEHDAVRIVERFGSFDTAIIPYGGASFYPHAFPQFDAAEKARRRDALTERMLDQFVEIAGILKASKTIPAAGSYVMGGRIAEFSEYLHQAAPGQIRARWAAAGNSPEALSILGPGDSLDVASGAIEMLGGALSFNSEDRLAYARTLRNRPLDQDLISVPRGFKIPWKRMLQRARAVLWGYQQRFSACPEHDVILVITPGKGIALPEDRSICVSISLDSEELRFEAAAPVPGRPWSQFTLDAAMMLMLLIQAANWNNVEIAALVELEREPDRYDPTLHTLMNFFFI
ncbi:MBL fold metallo-hydrolase [Pelagibius litoralis]|uniref:MBL fold metallo-hydrolase n=1 Tax=Pelagibius litoralis TaxID=374515 RepID=A0A967EWQ5_9PROT|nr:MBL fold metallo-hydrolase [Pelagibius litoralis]NIA67833.1 MBL fold metallo-hydrolase [Pelagibius litoralis]